MINPMQRSSFSDTCKAQRLKAETLTVCLAKLVDTLEHIRKTTQKQDLECAACVCTFFDLEYVNVHRESGKNKKRRIHTCVYTRLGNAFFFQQPLSCVYICALFLKKNTHSTLNKSIFVSDPCN